VILDHRDTGRSPGGALGFFSLGVTLHLTVKRHPRLLAAKSDKPARA
jgi:hypothetical protein